MNLGRRGEVAHQEAERESAGPDHRRKTELVTEHARAVPSPPLVTASTPSVLDIE